MVRQIAGYLSKRWVERNIITSDAYDCYVYGWEVIILIILEVANILIIGICSDTLGSAVIFLVTFVSVRRYTGGYHAKTCLRCNICLSMLYLLNLYITFNLKFMRESIIITFLLVGLIVIYLIGPIEHINKKISPDQVNRNKIISMALFSLCCVISFLFVKIDIYVASIISITLFEILILMLIAKFTAMFLKTDNS